MATPKIIADFETQLGAAISIADTSFTLSTAVDDDGVALPAGLYYFTLDNGTTQKEYLEGTLSGTAVTGVSNISRQGAVTAGALKAHRVGSSVVLTDFMTYKKYIDETSLAGAPDASTSTKGVVETATLAQVRARTASGETGAALAITPDVADDMPTQDEKAALAGGGAFGTPSGSNKFVTEKFFVAPQVVTFTSSGTWTKDAGLKYVVVETQAGGGGGGTSRNGGGGGGGGYSKKLILASALGATEVVTRGAGGAAESAGGNSSFGTHAQATGGLGESSDGVGANAGIGSLGDINTEGGDGHNRAALGDDSNNTSGIGGNGGSSFYGGGGRGGFNQTNGQPGNGYGGGGGGGGSYDGDAVGGAGAAGIIIVTEYY